MGNRNELRKPGPPVLGPKEDRNFGRVVGAAVTFFVALGTHQIEPTAAVIIVASLINSVNEFRTLRKTN